MRIYTSAEKGRQVVSLIEATFVPNRRGIRFSVWDAGSILLQEKGHVEDYLPLGITELIFQDVSEIDHMIAILKSMKESVEEDEKLQKYIESVGK